MTQQSNSYTEIPEDTQVRNEELPPQIDCEIDIPFDTRGNLNCRNYSVDNLGKTDSLDDQITKFKYQTGKQVLYVSMGAMALMVLISIALSVFELENALVENSFEVFKLIAMTVLGYIFGSKTK